MSEQDLLADCLKDSRMNDLIKRLRDEPTYSQQLNGLNPFEMNVWHNTACEGADALEQSQKTISLREDRIRLLDAYQERSNILIEQLEAALRPMAQAHKSDRPYNEITLNDCRVAHDLLFAGDSGND